MFQHPPGSGAARGFFFEATTVSQLSSSQSIAPLNVRAFNEILETFAPFDPVFRFILQFRDGLSDDIREQLDQTGSRLHLRTIRGEGESMLGHLKQCHPQRPYVGRDSVGLPGDPFGSHIIGSANECVGVAFGAEFTAHAKIAELHLAITAQENIGWLDVCRDMSTGGYRAPCRPSAYLDE